MSDVINLWDGEKYEPPPQSEILRVEILKTIQANCEEMDLANILLVIDQIRDGIFCESLGTPEIEVIFED